MLPKKKKLIAGTNDLKRKFYLKKLECACLEKRTQFIDYHIAKQRQKLLSIEIEIKKIELARAKQA